MFLEESFATDFVTGGPGGARVLVNEGLSEQEAFVAYRLPVAAGTQASGAFSIERRDQCCWVVVGGTYTKPDDANGTAAYTHDGGKKWQPSRTLPHGYRSSVAYDVAHKTWITVGPNGTDVSADDGKNWRPLHPDPARHEPPDADRDWNALSLPFVVGPKGRIGKLNAAALER